MSKLPLRGIRSGFSLIESIAVVCIVTVLASGSLLYLSSVLQQSHGRGSLNDVDAILRSARQMSRRENVTLWYDLVNQEIAMHAVDSRTSGTFQIDKNMRLLKLLIDGAPIERGVARIDFKHGGCPSHAVLIERGGTRRWYVCSGVVGGYDAIDADANTENRLALWQASWSRGR